MMLRRDLERARPVVEVLEEVAARHGATPAQVALNWVVSFQGEGVVAIPGASKARHAAENAAACGFRLSEEELGRLDEVSRG
jgi:aryl-alcohol dehydrogenase-like predicted oxidoreductase